MKKMRCPKCGSDELQFVKYTYHSYNTGIAVLFASMMLIGIGFEIFLFMLIREGWNLIKNLSSIPDRTAMVLLFFLTMFLLGIIFILVCLCFLINGSYKPITTIEYVCPCCGDNDDIDKAIREDKSTPVAKPDDTE